MHCKNNLMDWHESLLSEENTELLYRVTVNNPLLRPCNLTSFSPCLTGPVNYLFASCHKGPGFKSPEGYLCETGILLLAISRYTI
jgi:hypothetical protein